MEVVLWRGCGEMPTRECGSENGKGRQPVRMPVPGTPVAPPCDSLGAVGASPGHVPRVSPPRGEEPGRLPTYCSPCLKAEAGREQMPRRGWWGAQNPPVSSLISATSSLTVTGAQLQNQLPPIWMALAHPETRGSEGRTNSVLLV